MENKYAIATTNIILPAQLLLIAAVIAPLLYCTIILLYAVNVPVGDDYALLAFMNDFQALSAPRDKISLFFSFHNEHRLLVTRAVSLLVKLTFGSLDFRILILIGNAALLATLFQLGKALSFGNDIFKWALLFLIVLQPQTQKLMFYPMAIIQAYMGLLFAVMYLRYLIERKNIIFLMIFYLLNVITTGSGIFLVAIGVPFLAYRKQRSDLIIHLAISTVTIYFYFHGYSSEDSSRLYYLVKHPMEAISFFLRLLGAISEQPYHFANMFSHLPLAIGFILAVYFIFHLSMTIRAQHIAPEAWPIKPLIFLLYCIMMLLLIVVGRTETYHDDLIDAALDSRYRIYGIIFTAFVLIDVLYRLQLRGFLSYRTKVSVLVLALAFNIGWFYSRLDSMRNNAEDISKAMQVYLADQNPSFLPTWAVSRRLATRNLDLAIFTGVYKP